MKRTIALVAGSLPLLLAAALLAAPSWANRGREARSLQDAQLAAAKEATKGFLTPAGALAAGYIPVSPCVSSPFGGMGVHYLNPQLARKTVMDILNPAELTYRPTPEGLALASLEYHLDDADQNLATDGDRPTLFGVPFDGPMPGHGPPANPGPIHYDLHVWLWFHNPSGMFSQWNPLLVC